VTLTSLISQEFTQFQVLIADQSETLDLLTCAGEDVLAQLRVMDLNGGCGLIPSGVYHLQFPTTIPDRLVDAPKYLEIGVKKNESASA